jgi:hypothetical protein
VRTHKNKRKSVEKAFPGGKARHERTLQLTNVGSSKAFQSFLPMAFQESPSGAKNKGKSSPHQ